MKRTLESHVERVTESKSKKMKHPSKHLYTSWEMRPTCKKASEELNGGVPKKYR